jgi:hypothetical protein
MITNVGHAACSVPGTPTVNLIGPSDADGSTFSLEPAAENQPNQPNPKNPFRSGSPAAVNAAGMVLAVGQWVRPCA